MVGVVWAFIVPLIIVVLIQSCFSKLVCRELLRLMNYYCLVFLHSRVSGLLELHTFRIEIHSHGGYVLCRFLYPMIDQLFASITKHSSTALFIALMREVFS
jgi:hypothetical protein